jgi:hypothetical protein
MTALCRITYYRDCDTLLSRERRKIESAKISETSAIEPTSTCSSHPERRPTLLRSLNPEEARNISNYMFLAEGKTP